jgi:hypothetical protein
VSKVRVIRATERRSVRVASALLLVAVVATAGFVGAALAGANPPAPTIDARPANPTTASSAVFKFHDTRTGVTFVCSRDGALFAKCSSGITYTGLAQGNHSFQVKAVAGGSTSSATTVAWAIVPPAPQLLSHPTNPTGAVTARFTYVDSQSAVAFKCALDGAGFTPCSAGGVTYAGLAKGTHTFAVKAQVGTKPPSKPTSFTWSIDTTAPAVTLQFPKPYGAYNAAAWSAGCPAVGACGTAVDPSGVKSVAVAIQQQSSGKYWNGSSYSSSSIVYNPGTTAWGYATTRPIDGLYTLYVRATDRFGNTTAGSGVAVPFTIDTLAPSAPNITTEPASVSPDASPSFQFASSGYPTRYMCRLDGGVPAPCATQPEIQGQATAPGATQYTTVSNGGHCFTVFATDAANNAGPSTTYCWAVIGNGGAIATHSGSNQYTGITTTFSSPLAAAVTDSSGPVPGVAVTFHAPASGASGSFASPCSGTTCVVTTGANGIATAPAFTANGTAGGYTITAGAAGLGPATFSLVNTVAFTVSGDLGSPFYPGGSQPMDLVITNPNPSPITIAAGAVDIGIATNTAACPASPNFAVTQGLGSDVTVPGGATKSLSDLSVPTADWPVIAMIETHTNQDACAGASLRFTFTGSAFG